jgi:predicted transposase/invertase (TIGR01784 family)
MAFVSNDKEALRAYQMREMALSDWTSGINHAKREGRVEGKAEGKIEIARKMKADKEPVEKIMLYTDLTLDEIKEI